jgi:predicted Zn-dependent protease with MMP-like domain
VAQAIEKLPPEFKKKMDNLEVFVEDFADFAALQSVGLESKWDLLGLYVGVPLTQRSVFNSVFLPERIYLFRKPILRAAGGLRHLQAQITSVIVHELGHHFGFDDCELDQLSGDED